MKALIQRAVVIDCSPLCEYSLLCLAGIFNSSSYLVCLCPFCKRVYYISSSVEYYGYVCYLPCELSKSSWCTVDKYYVSESMLVKFKARPMSHLIAVPCDGCYIARRHV